MNDFFNEIIKTTPSIGDEVRYLSNSNSSNYIIGNFYKISSIHDNDTFILRDSQGRLGNYATLNDLEIKNKTIKEILKEIIEISEELELIKEFISDYDNDEINNNSNNIEKEYKTFKLLKVIKSSKSDFEKIKILSEHIK